MHTHTHTHILFLSLFSKSLWFRTLLFHWLDKPSIAFKYSYLCEEELWSMNGGNSKDFLLTLPIPGHLKQPRYYFQPFAFGGFSLCWGERALSSHKRRDTKTARKVKVEMFLWQPAQGHLDNNMKLGPAGRHLFWHRRLRVPFCHHALSLFFPRSPTLPHLHKLTHSQERGWLDGFFFSLLQWELAEQKSWHLQGKEKRRCC